ncbi:MAG: M56 family metallopeptidase [Clostridium sp.]|uniref:M56 family metallopeptidase n=1 Tax=Clostridium sp. TaxID=1506 RepID=UPI003F2D40E8
MVWVFGEVLELSIICSYIIVFLIIVRGLLKKAPKVFSYGLWFILLIKIFIPINISSPLGIMEKDKGMLIVEGRDVIGEIIRLESYSESLSISGMSVISVVWAIIGIGIFLFIICSMFKVKRALKDSIYERENIYKSEKIKTAFVFGVIKPKIYLPKGLSSEEEKYIIAHEKIHIKRLDYLVKAIWYGLLSINWFNPLFWLAFNLMTKDMESSCDEKVIKDMGIGIKKDYSNLLLNLSNDEDMAIIKPIGFGYNEVRERVGNILNYKKPKKIIIGMGILVIFITGVAFLTNKENKEIEIRAKVEADKLLEDKNTNLEKKYKNPTIINDYEHKSNDEIENLVYETAIKRSYKYYEGEFTILAIQMNGVYKEDDKIKVFATIFSTGYVLENKKLHEENGSSMPTAITYKDNKDGTYTVEKYEETLDGALFAPSIEEYCIMPVSGKKIKGLDKKIIDNYSSEELIKLEREHLIKHLNENGEHGVSLGEYNDDLVLEYNKIN